VAGRSNLAPDFQFFRGKGVRGRFLIERVERGSECEERGNPLNHLPKPTALVVGERISIAAIGLPVAEPLLQDGIAAKLIMPD